MTNTIEIIYCLDKRGIKHANSGFFYLKELLEMMVEEQKLHKNIHDYYKEISKKYEVNPANIERAIRYSIENTGLTNKEFAFQIYTDVLCLNNSAERQRQQSGSIPLQNKI